MTHTATIHTLTPSPTRVRDREKQREEKEGKEEGPPHQMAMWPGQVGQAQLQDPQGALLATGSRAF